MFWLDRLIRYCNITLLFVGAFSVIAMMFHITIDVVMRPFGSFSVPATLTMVTKYYMIALTLLPLAWVEKNQSMIVVEVLSKFYKGWVLTLNNFSVNFASFCLYSILAKATWHQAIDQFHAGTYAASLNIHIPIWPAFFILPLSFSLASLVCMARLFQHKLEHKSLS